MNKNNDLYLSVIVPCYNEERNIRLGALENVAHFLNKKNYKWEVLIIDDGSSDDSCVLINSFVDDHPGFRLLTKIHQGKAAAVSFGVLKAKGEFILFTDMDQATPIDQLDKLIMWFKNDYDLVIGSRNSQRSGAPLLRLAMARGFMFLRNLILNLGIDDTQCGFKAFTYKAARELFPKLKVYSPDRIAYGSTVTAGFDVELLYLAKKSGFKIKEVAVEWHYQETRNVNPIKDSWEGIYDLIKIRLYSLLGFYK